MLKEVPKLVTKAIFAVTFTKLLGPLGIPVGLLLSENLMESFGEYSEKFFEKLGEETGLKLAESQSEIFGFLKGNSDLADESAPDYTLARLLAKVWETRLNKLIKSKNFVGIEFKKQTKLLTKWRDKFKEAQDETKLYTFYEIFPKDTAPDFAIEQKSFETITNQNNAEDHLWKSLKKTLDNWTTKEEKIIFENIETDVRKALTEDLQSDLVIQLKNNETFRASFHTTFEFFATENLKKINVDVKELRNISEGILNSLKPQVYYSSKTLKNAVLAYLFKVQETATGLSEIYLQKIETVDDKAAFFNEITQRFQIVKKEQIDSFRANAKLSEQATIFGIEEFEKKIYDQRGFETKLLQKSANEEIEIYEWNDESRENFNRNIILGDPGLGKSWLLNFEANKLATEAIEILQNTDDTPEKTSETLRNIKIPILLRIADIAAAAQNNKELFLTIAETASFDEEDNDDKKHLFLYLKETITKHKTAVLLLDALDEVPEDADNGLTRKQIADKISKFAGTFPEISILLTSRKVNYEPVKLYNNDQSSASDDNLEILPFDETQIKNYVAGWFGKDSEISKIFLFLLEKQPQTAGLSQNPLMLSLMCRLFYEKQINNKVEIAEKYFPNSRCEIYEQCLQGFLRDWKDEKIKRTIRPSELQSEIRKLERTAFNLFVKGYEQFSETDFQAAFCGIENIDLISEADDEKSQAFLAECKSDGIITETTKGKNPQYRFIHLTFQEYLTASYLAKQTDWKEFIFEKYKNGLQNKILFNPDWQHTLQLLGGKLAADQDIKDYIERLLQENGKNGEGDLLFRPFILAMFVAAEAQNKLDDEFLKNINENLINLTLNHPSYLPIEYFVKPMNHLGETIFKILMEKVENFLQLEMSSIQQMNFIKILELLNFQKLEIIKSLYKLLQIPQKDKFLSTFIQNAFISFRSNDQNIFDWVFNTLKNQVQETNAADRNLMIVLAKHKNFGEDHLNWMIELLENTDHQIEFRRNVAIALNNQRKIKEKFIQRLLENLKNKKHNFQIRQSIAQIIASQEKISSETTSSLLNILTKKEFIDEVRKVIANALKLNKNLSEEQIGKLFHFCFEKTKSAKVKASIFDTLCFQQNLSEDIVNAMVNLIAAKETENNLRSSIAGSLGRQKNFNIWNYEKLLGFMENEQSDPKVKLRIAELFKQQRQIPEQINKKLKNYINNNPENDLINNILAKPAFDRDFYQEINPDEIIKNLTEINENPHKEKVSLFKLFYSGILQPQQINRIIDLLENENKNHKVREYIAFKLSEINLSDEQLKRVLRFLINYVFNDSSSIYIFSQPVKLMFLFSSKLNYCVPQNIIGGKKS